MGRASARGNEHRAASSHIGAKLDLRVLAIDTRVPSLAAARARADPSLLLAPSHAQTADASPSVTTGGGLPPTRQEAQPTPSLELRSADVPG